MPRLSPIVDHAHLLNVTANQHHAQAHTLASHSTKAHTELTGVSTSQHHTKTVASELNLADMAEKSHASLSNVTASQHHAKYLDTEAVAAVLVADDYVKNTGDIITGSLEFTGGHLKLAGTQIWFLEGETAKYTLQYKSASNYFTISEYGVADHFVIKNGGLFGFGVTDPTEKVDIAGNLKLGDGKYLYLNGVGAYCDWKIKASGNSIEFWKVEEPDDVIKASIYYSGGVMGGTLNIGTIVVGGLVDGVDISAHAVNAGAHHTPGITFNLGLATVGIKQAQALIPGTLTISKVKIYADTAPVGASLIVDINKNGTTIFTTQANRPAIPSGGHADDSGTPNITSLAEGDRLSVDVDQVGSTTPGGNDLLVTIIC